MRDFSGSEAAAAACRPWLMMFRTADSPEKKVKDEVYKPSLVNVSIVSSVDYT
jgi:hypothetical protein